MVVTADEPDEAVKNDLAGSIRKRRSDCNPGGTARQLLAYDTPDHTHLVGIDHEGNKVVYYSCRRGEVIFVRFDSDGLSAGGPVLGSFEKGLGFEAWIEKMAAYWGWLHPRYR